MASGRERAGALSDGSRAGAAAMEPTQQKHQRVNLEISGRVERPPQQQDPGEGAPPEEAAVSVGTAAQQLEPEVDRPALPRPHAEVSSKTGPDAAGEAWDKVTPGVPAAAKLRMQQQDTAPGPPAAGAAALPGTTTLQPQPGSGSHMSLPRSHAVCDDRAETARDTVKPGQVFAHGGLPAGAEEEVGFGLAANPTSLPREASIESVRGKAKRTCVVG